ncbi:hypothetical protein MKQ70_06875 [Chitinophaga sedimenti]|uniref:hypothetical protein n=1 Tax=Chitinophaga sedimenti TaxID=2033606 RepID=UPI00200696AB|nr:hypothetical protein [Chitinophaga sedimenti]MCK7554739.1 hypothetical protein [Chitinophaga sedimenti]
MTEKLANVASIHIDYSPNSQMIHILTITSGGPYSITVTKNGNIPLYYAGNVIYPDVYVGDNLVVGDVINVSVSVPPLGTAGASYTYTGAPNNGSNPPPGPASFSYEVYSDLAKTEVRVHWTFNSTYPQPPSGSKYYLYMYESCPPRGNDFYETVGEVPAENQSFTLTRYRWYTTFDWAEVGLMFKGVPISTPGPNFWANGSFGSYVYIRNITTSDAYTMNPVTVYASTFPYVL